VFVLLALSAFQALGVTYDLAADFGATNNPSGAWSYGWKQTEGGAFNLFTNQESVVAGNGVPLEVWSYLADDVAEIGHNGTTNTALTGAGTYPPGATWINPGENSAPDNFGGIRFTVPAGAGGTYLLASSVLPYLDGAASGDNEYRVVQNGTEIFGQFLSAGSGTNFDATLALAVGDTLDFLSGRGADSNAYAAGLKISVTLTEVTNLPPPPPPSTNNLVYDLSEQFSGTNNPSGAWAYGWKGAVGGEFNVFTNYQVNAGYIEAWSLAVDEQAAVFHNPTTNVFESDGSAFPPGTTWLAPGVDGAPDNFGAVRFTVPANGGGTYLVSSYAAPYLTNSPAGDNDYHVAQNGVEIFGRFLAPRVGVGYTNTLSLAPGDTLDFLSGRGADGDAYASGLDLQVTITQLTNSPSGYLTISPLGPYFTNQVAVTIASQPTNATIYYTLDGAAPSTNSTVYTAPVVLTGPATIAAQAFINGEPVSGVFSQSYADVYVTGNLIPAAWYVQYFGSNYLTNPNAAPTADPDGDGMNNYQEYASGTNPLDPTSVLKITRFYLTTVNANPVIIWQSVAGKTYTAQRLLVNTTNWVSVGAVTATSGESVFTDASATSTNSSLYRLQVQQ
jgi:hypothetical protein